MNEHLAAFEKYESFSKKNKPATEVELAEFETRTKLILPDDLKEYFLLLNGADEYDKCFIEFYSLQQFKTVQEEVGDFGGIPDYRDILKVLPEHINCYVFANHSIHLLVYAIRLYPYKSELNEVYTILGSEYQLVTNSFNEFISNYARGQHFYI